MLEQRQAARRGMHPYACSKHAACACPASATQWPCCPYLPFCRSQVGDSVTATLTVDKRSGSRVTFRTLCRDDGSGRVLVEGAALALIKQQQQQQLPQWRIVRPGQQAVD